MKAASGGSNESEEAGEEVAEELSEEELRAAKKELVVLRRQLKGLQKDFVAHLQKARSELDETSARELVMDILEKELRGILDRYVSDQRQAAVSVFETWWEKYQTTLGTIEHDRDQAAKEMRGFLMGLGYGA